MIRRIINSCILFCVACALCSCFSSAVTFEQKILAEADSLFQIGNYEHAKVKFAKVRDSKPKSDAAKKAQYYLGYINIFYDNPFSNWEAALREFKLFTALYPNDFRIGEVNSWIRLLVVMQSYKREYLGSSSKLEELSKKELLPPPPPVVVPKKMPIETITESLRNCYDHKDSLSRKTRELENVILDLERKCQQAGNR
jgi:tetratricopeptide (TPR) repeat protein